ncbi:MAG: hypothetical protein QG641_720 [Candidatus Poribacteria bacterium]|nr:hypothetical protein [Candidatus Poribacteria bacterium]
MQKTATIRKTNHPHIVRSPEICNSSPVVKGTRTRVIDIVIEYTMLGRSPDEIIDAHPYLDLASVHDVLSYYYERQQEIDVEIQDHIRYVEELKAKYPSKVKAKLELLKEYKDIHR